MIKAIIFDLDGVIVNSERLKSLAWKKVLEKYGVDNGDEWYKKNIGNTREYLAKKAIEEFSINDDWKILFDRKANNYFEMLKTTTEPIQSTVDFIKSIPKEKYKLAVNSAINKWVIEHQIGLIGISHLFDALTSGLDELPPHYEKPHPEIYLRTARKLNVLPEFCLGIEDSTPGVKSVKSAGMKCIGFINPNSGNQDLSEADLIVDDLRKVPLEFYNSQ